jgi:hypothetical protein
VDVERYGRGDGGRFDARNGADPVEEATRELL